MEVTFRDPSAWAVVRPSFPRPRLQPNQPRECEESPKMRSSSPSLAFVAVAAIGLGMFAAERVA
jgi:hypothetical protein